MEQFLCKLSNGLLFPNDRILPMFSDVFALDQIPGLFLGEGWSSCPCIQANWEDVDLDELCPIPLGSIQR
jgi:hypothetical protein